MCGRVWIILGDGGGETDVKVDWSAVFQATMGVWRRHMNGTI